ncbi:MAG: serine hydrolase domain-containing protein, partial [Pseudobdellovibrionaceae bacterium]
MLSSFHTYGKRITALLTILFFMTPSCVHKSNSSDSISREIASVPYFPTKGWKRADLKDVGMDPEKFKEFTKYVESKEYKFKTDSVVVIKDGYLVYDYYNNGYKEGQPHMLWSFSKGIANAVLGAAEKKGYLHRYTKVASYYPEVAKDPRGYNMTLDHLMHMSSGLGYYEEHPKNIIFSDSIFINYSYKGYKDMALFTAQKSLLHEPGTKFNYSSGECNLAMGILKKGIANQKEYDTFPWTGLFNKLGMSSTRLEQDAAGTFVAGSFGWSAATDIAKLGYLYLNNGVWNGERIFPEVWVDYSLKPAQALMNTLLVQANEMRLNQEAYGAYWWLNKKLPMNEYLPYPGTPEDAFLAMGYKGQTLAVIPSLNMIVVRLGNDGIQEETKLDRVKMLRLLVQSVNSPNPAPLIAHHSSTSAMGHGAFEFGTVTGFWKTLKAIGKNNIGLDDGFVLAPAKDLCSCIFVVKQDQNFCLQNHEQYQQFRSNFWIRSLIGVGEAKIDPNKKSVTVEARTHKATATYV